MKRHPYVIAVTGASGAVYAVRLLQEILKHGHSVHLVVSPSGEAVIAQELGMRLIARQDAVMQLIQYAWPDCHSKWPNLSNESAQRLATQVTLHDHRDFMTPIASGSFRTQGMVVCPCSGSTLSGIVHASGNNLIHRAAEVHLKEHRKLILVPRETPMSSFQLENLHRAATAGAIVLPAMPGWYQGVSSIVDLIDFIVARILDHLDIDHQLMSRWGDSSLGDLADYSRTGED